MAKCPNTILTRKKNPFYTAESRKTEFVTKQAFLKMLSSYKVAVLKKHLKIIAW